MWVYGGVWWMEAGAQWKDDNKRKPGTAESSTRIWWEEIIKMFCKNKWKKKTEKNVCVCWSRRARTILSLLFWRRLNHIAWHTHTCILLMDGWMMMMSMMNITCVKHGFDFFFRMRSTKLIKNNCSNIFPPVFRRSSKQQKRHTLWIERYSSIVATWDFPKIKNNL